MILLSFNTFQKRAFYLILSVLSAESLQSCLTLCDPMESVARQAPLSMGILQARILEWVAVPSSRESSRLRDRICVCHIGRWILYF